MHYEDQLNNLRDVLIENLIINFFCHLLAMGQSAGPVPLALFACTHYNFQAFSFVACAAKNHSRNTSAVDCEGMLLFLL